MLFITRSITCCNCTNLRALRDIIGQFQCVQRYHFPRASFCIRRTNLSMVSLMSDRTFCVGFFADADPVMTSPARLPSQ